MRRGGWGLVLAIMLSLLIGGGAGVYVLARVLDRTESNREAIISSCETLNAKIRESQKPPPKDSATALLISELVKLLPRDKVREYFKRAARENKQGGRLRPADCEAAARKAER